MNFLIFRDFSDFFMKFSEFKIDLFDLNSIKITFYFHAGDVAARGASDCTIKLRSSIKARGDAATCGASYRAIKSRSSIVS